MFLQPISGLLAALLLMLSTGCGGSVGSGTVPAGPAAGGLAEVVAGTGQPSQATVDTVRRLVEEQEVPLRALFAQRPKHPFFVHVHADRDQMPDSLAANLHPDSPGFALLGAHQIHLVWGEMRRTGASLRGVVVHELVHELLEQFVEPHGRLIPRWFHEGLAQNIAGDTYLGVREDELVWRVTTGHLLPFGGLRKSFPDRTEELRSAYAQSYSYVAWLTREYGLESLLAVAAATDDLTSFERALVGRTGRSTLDLERSWQDHLLGGSGAPWRVLFDQCFSLLLIFALPILALAMIRRLAADKRAAARMARSEAELPIVLPTDAGPDAEAHGLPDDDGDLAPPR